jgi:hypothetical protein
VAALVALRKDRKGLPHREAYIRPFRRGKRLRTFKS